MSETQIRFAVFLTALFALYVSAAMLLPAAVDYYYGNRDWQVFAMAAMVVGGLAAVTMTAMRTEIGRVSARFGFLLVNGIWFSTVMVGSVPFMLASVELNFADAVFESVSGLTTTGSTVLVGLDELPPGLLLWRSMLQWMGGLGVIALGLFVLPYLRVGGNAYFRIESSDRADQPFSRFSTYMIALVTIYAALTALCTLCYALAGMTPFDAVNHAMTTLSTGGFSTHDASFGHFAENSLILWIGTVFMFVGGLPFTVMILLLLRGRPAAGGDPQIKVYATYCAIFAFGVAIYLRFAGDADTTGALTQSAFNFVSMITTTGYASTDYSLWGPFAVACAFVATFLGGCTGSTAGGIKAYRFLVLLEMLGAGMNRLVYPHSVKPIRYGARNIDVEMQRSAALFVSSFFVVWVVLIVLLSATGLDFVTASTGALTALTNVGPGLGDIIGPAGNFSTLPDLAKWILDAAMLLGRLEILAVLVLFSPAFWR